MTYSICKDPTSLANTSAVLYFAVHRCYTYITWSLVKKAQSKTVIKQDDYDNKPKFWTH